jgi:MoxR-like ATPase
MFRHRLDTETVFTMEGYPDVERKEIEKAEVEYVAEANPETESLEAEPYHADDRLVDAVNLAISLGRPLLLQGDPGCGKTRLAYVVAYALKLPLERFYIKSTSRAQDLLYTYDAVTRLYDAQIQERKSRDVRHYIRLGPLGRAIERAQYGRRSVVLLDEIDKADLDFPNDLLWELDRLEFQVTEKPEIHYAAGDNPQLRPIVIVTHNEEKPLPPAFLRRCIFHYVEFPNRQEALVNILKLHRIENAGLSSKAAEVVRRLRQMEYLSKKPGLSELIDWVSYLDHKQVDSEELDTLPFISALLKQRTDQHKAKESFERKSRV